MSLPHCLDCCALTAIEARRRTFFRFASICSWWEDPDEVVAEGEIPTRYKIRRKTVTTTLKGNITGDEYIVYIDVYTATWEPDHYVTNEDGSACGILREDEERDPRDEDLEPESPDTLLISTFVEEYEYDASFGTAGDIESAGRGASPDVDLDTGWKTVLLVNRSTQDSIVEDDVVLWDVAKSNLMSYSFGDDFNWSGGSSLLEVRIKPGMARIAGDLHYDIRLVNLGDDSESTVPGVPIRISVSTEWEALLEPEMTNGFQRYYENIRFIPLR